MKNSMFRNLFFVLMAIIVVNVIGLNVQAGKLAENVAALENHAIANLPTSISNTAIRAVALSDGATPSPAIGCGPALATNPVNAGGPFTVTLPVAMNDPRIPQNILDGCLGMTKLAIIYGNGQNGPADPAAFVAAQTPQNTGTIAKQEVVDTSLLNQLGYKIDTMWDSQTGMLENEQARFTAIIGGPSSLNCAKIQQMMKLVKKSEGNPMGGGVIINVQSINPETGQVDNHVAALEGISCPPSGGVVKIADISGSQTLNLVIFTGADGHTSTQLTDGGGDVVYTVLQIHAVHG